MWEYRDSWDGTTYTRQIAGTTLQVLLTHTAPQHLFAFSNLTDYTTLFPTLSLPHSPLLLGRGSHSHWRPLGFANQGPRPLHALQIYVPLPRVQFLAQISHDPGNRTYFPGEVIHYGPHGLETCVTLNDDIAIPLEIYGPQELQLPTWLNLSAYSTEIDGSRILSPLWTLITQLQQAFQIRIWMSQGYGGLETRLRALKEDIHDLRYLCYSQARFQGVRADVTDQRLSAVRVWTEGYLRGFVGTDVETEAERTTAMDQLIVIGLVEGEVQGVRYDLPGQREWVYNPRLDPFA
jgi:hypothetical protein